jgi:hypothetical protein
MGMLTDDMARLRSEIIGLRGARVELSKNIIQSTKDRKVAVEVMERGFHNAHADMAWTAKKDRLAFLSGITGSVASMQVGFHKDLADIRDAHAKMAMETKQERAAFVSALKSEVSGLEAGFRYSHAQMAKETKAARLAFVSDQKNSVSGMRADFRNAHAEMAKSSHNGRVAFLSGIKELVTNMRQEFASEITSARQAWLGITPFRFHPPQKTAQPEMVVPVQKQQETERQARIDAERAANVEAEHQAKPAAEHEAGHAFSHGVRETGEQSHARSDKKSSRKDKSSV